ncbi:MAG: L-seryl-tRNA(Sec) selenium transferase [Acidimicrobiia bacterium]
MSANPYRELPAVDVLAGEIESTLPLALVVDVARLVLEEARKEIASGRAADPSAAAHRLVRAMERAAGAEVVNATGVLLHTNLGRAPWSERAVDRAAGTASGYTSVEIDLESGERSRRGVHVERLLTRLTGAEAAHVVNNNASALLIALASTARDKSVPVARGELIEIGGSYRLPDVVEASGARLVEIGTTNRTRLGDYQTAIQTHDCGAILKVHPSNYRVEGFTEETPLPDLAGLAASAGLPLIYDIGSGLLNANAAWLPDWMRGEPGARQALAEGADLVMFSGDKLLGGPQAGVLLGSASLIEAIRRHPLARALRVDGVTYAALAATLEEYLDGPPVEIPFWRQALTGEEELTARCQELAARVDGTVEPGSSAVGAGSAPGIGIPTPVVRLSRSQDLYRCLLDQDRPVLARRDAGDLIIDLRAVDSSDDETVAAAILKCR